MPAVYVRAASGGEGVGAGGTGRGATGAATAAASATSGATARDRTRVLQRCCLCRIRWPSGDSRSRVRCARIGTGAWTSRSVWDATSWTVAPVSATGAIRISTRNSWTRDGCRTSGARSRQHALRRRCLGCYRTVRPCPWRPNRARAGESPVKGFWSCADAECVRRLAVTRPLCAHRDACLDQAIRDDLDDLDCTGCDRYERDPRLEAQSPLQSVDALSGSCKAERASGRRGGRS